MQIERNVLGKNSTPIFFWKANICISLVSMGEDSLYTTKLRSLVDIPEQTVLTDDDMGRWSCCCCCCCPCSLFFEFSADLFDSLADDDDDVELNPSISFRRVDNTFSDTPFVFPSLALTNESGKRDINEGEDTNVYKLPFLYDTNIFSVSGVVLKLKYKIHIRVYVR